MEYGNSAKTSTKEALAKMPLFQFPTTQKENRKCENCSIANKIIILPMFISYDVSHVSRILFAIL